MIPLPRISLIILLLILAAKSTTLKINITNIQNTVKLDSVLDIKNIKLPEYITIKSIFYTNNYLFVVTSNNGLYRGIIESTAFKPLAFGTLDDEPLWINASKNRVYLLLNNGVFIAYNMAFSTVLSSKYLGQKPLSFVGGINNGRLILTSDGALYLIINNTVMEMGILKSNNIPVFDSHLKIHQVKIEKVAISCGTNELERVAFFIDNTSTKALLRDLKDNKFVLADLSLRNGDVVLRACKLIGNYASHISTINTFTS